MLLLRYYCNNIERRFLFFFSGSVHFMNIKLCSCVFRLRFVIFSMYLRWNTLSLMSLLLLPLLDSPSYLLAQYVLVRVSAKE